MGQEYIAIEHESFTHEDQPRPPIFSLRSLYWTQTQEVRDEHAETLRGLGRDTRGMLSMIDLELARRAGQPSVQADALASFTELVEDFTDEMLLDLRREKVQHLLDIQAHLSLSLATKQQLLSGRVELRDE